VNCFTLAAEGGNVIEWLRLARRPSVVRRALGYAIGVGILLIAINHGDAILRGDVSLGGLLRMSLTIVVPYSVSTASSVSALREHHQPGSATRT
jgi:hypothetical protein